MVDLSSMLTFFLSNLLSRSEEEFCRIQSWTLHLDRVQIRFRADLYTSLPREEEDDKGILPEVYSTPETTSTNLTCTILGQMQSFLSSRNTTLILVAFMLGQVLLPRITRLCIQLIYDHINFGSVSI